MLDGAVKVEAAAKAGEADAALLTTTVDDAGAEAEACPVVVDPVACVAAGVGVGVPCAFSFCACLVALPKPCNLPIIQPPGVPGVAAPFPLGPLPFPVTPLCLSSVHTLLICYLFHQITTYVYYRPAFLPYRTSFGLSHYLDT